MSGIIAQNVGRHTGLVKAAGGGGAWNLIQTIDSDGSDATMDFTSGLDSTYDEYVFLFNSIHPEEAAGGREFQFNLSIDGGSNYNVTKTTTAFYAFHSEADDDVTLGYDPAEDLAQSTAFQHLANPMGIDNDQCCSGYLCLFNPADTTFVKQFMSIANINDANDVAYNWHIGGYANTTSAVNAIRFQINSGEIQGGSISMYGVS